MRVGIAQINTVPGAFDQTVAQMVAQSQTAAERGVELLVFPLAALAGVEVVPYADRASFMRDVADALSSLSEQLACPALVPVLMDLGDERGDFDVALLDDGAITPIRMMSRLQALSSPAPQQDVDVPELEFGGVRIALALSHSDLDVLGGYDYDVDVAVYFSEHPFALDDPSSAMGACLDNGRFVDDARRISAWFVGTASLGGYSDEVFSGSSFVLDPTGELVASAPAFEEDLLVAEVGGPAAEPHDVLMPEVFDAPFALWQAVSLGVHDFVTKHGHADAALCLDGTIGSMVLAALASDALGPRHVHVLVGASAGSAAPVCRDLARRLRVDVTSSSGAPRGIDPRDFDELELAALAREHGALALSSLDKTALALGTRACEVSVAVLCPLGDVYRSDILDMARVRNTISPLFKRVRLRVADELMLPLAAKSVLPIAGEHDIARIDQLLFGHIEYDRPLAELVPDAPLPEEVVCAVLRAHRQGELARRAAPPVLAMSTRTLDDARFPLGVRWHDEHADDASLLSGGSQALGSRVMEGGAEADHGPAPDASSPAGGVDLDATLALLRDLAEQGGFVSPDLASLEALSGADLRSVLESGGNPMSPFSEN